MGIAAAFFEFERPFEDDERFEPIGFLGFTTAQIFVAPYTECLIDSTSISAYHIIIHVPSFYAQGDFREERIPRIRGAEAGEV